MSNIMPNINSDIIAGQWKIIKGKIRAKWGEFTDQEIEKMEGTQEELEGALQKKYGYKKAEARNQLHSFMEDLKTKANTKNNDEDEDNNNDSDEDEQDNEDNG